MRSAKEARAGAHAQAAAARIQAVMEKRATQGLGKGTGGIE